MKFSKPAPGKMHGDKKENLYVSLLNTEILLDIKFGAKISEANTG